MYNVRKTVMEFLYELMGRGSHLNPLQMSVRGIFVFIFCLILIRFSGRRSFGMRMPFDNVVAMLMGAVLSRAVTGESPFMATLCASTTIAVLYRLFAWVALYSDKFGSLIKGEAKVLYDNGEMNRENMKYALITEKDLKEGLRKN